MGEFEIVKSYYQRLIEKLQHSWTIVAPVTAADGICRLQTVTEINNQPCSNLPFFPFKKFLLPANEILWTCQEDADPLPPNSTPPAKLALVDAAPCDLYALDYLDQIYRDDSAYQGRRQQLLVVGAECSPTPHCHCPPHSAPPPFDLFLAEGSVWSGSDLGDTIMPDFADAVECRGREPLPLKYWGAERENLPIDLAQRFEQSATDPLWQQEASRCLSCGACSAVCPTCACYDVVDEVALTGEIKRQRVWDNCFFREHALVAGGHNFRPDRTARLRFRFEHKYLGFGAQRGVSSCVGCGRCLQACPVKIDLAQILAHLANREGR